MQAVLLIDFGSTFTKVTVVDLDSESVLGTGRAFTTVRTDINEGLKEALENLKKTVGTIDFQHRYACSSAAGGLKMIAVGLVPELTAEAAKRAALSAGAKVMKVYSYELSSAEAEEICFLSPDILLLTGGTDGGNQKVILHNARLIAGVAGEFPVIVAGNKSISEDVAAILCAAGKDVRVCENVMPSFNVLNIEPARDVIRNLFLERIIRAKGLSKIKSIIEGIIMPTPSAVLEAAHCLAVGTEEEEGLGELLVVDVGGATTDVHSIAHGLPTKTGVMLKGLPEPYIKRTVEGDLGVRWSVLSLLEAGEREWVTKQAGLTMEEIAEYTNKIAQNPELLPKQDGKVGLIDHGLASLAVKIAVKRHTGTIENIYTPFGAAYLQKGKDLSDIQAVIGTGGPLIYGMRRRDALAQALYDETEPTSLRPYRPALMVDRLYIMSAMGLLAERHPTTALRIMKKELEVLK